jgi:hypothetical protein
MTWQVAGERQNSTSLTPSVAEIRRAHSLKPGQLCMEQKTQVLASILVEHRMSDAYC